MRRIVSLMLVVILVVSCVAVSFSVVSAAEAPQLSWHYGDGNYAEADYPEINDVLVTGNKVTFRFFPRKGKADWGYRFYVRTPDLKDWELIEDVAASTLTLKNGMYEYTATLMNNDVYKMYDKSRVGDLRKVGEYDSHGCWHYKHEFTVKALSAKNKTTGQFRGSSYYPNMRHVYVESDGLRNTCYSAPVLRPIDKSFIVRDVVYDRAEGECCFWRVELPQESLAYIKYLRVYHKNANGNWEALNKAIKICSNSIKKDGNVSYVDIPIHMDGRYSDTPVYINPNGEYEITVRALDRDGDWISAFLSGAKGTLIGNFYWKLTTNITK